MEPIVRNSCLNIPLIYKNESWFLPFVSQFARKEEDFQDQTKSYIKKYYHVNKDTMMGMFPRFYPIEQTLGFSVTESIPTGKIIDITVKSTPRNKIQEETVKFLLTNNKGIICLSPGEGKTVIAIMAVSQARKKTIVFAHKDFLIDQWKERFLEHSIIDKTQIVRLTTKTYKEDLKASVVLCTLQTMCRLIEVVPDLQRELFESNFGFAFWDECHTVGAEQFSKSALFTSANKVFGLSATPKRSDGNEDILHYHLGHTFIPKNTDSSVMQPKVIAVMFDHGVMTSDARYIMQCLEFDKQRGIKEPAFNRDRYLKRLLTSKSSKYLKYLSPIIKQISSSDRIMILLSERIKILDVLSGYCVNKNEVGFFLPREEKERDSNLKNKRLVFSTYQSCRDGVDKQEVDCLVMATPCGNWEQAIGRSIRPVQGKKQPIVIDVIDTGYDEFKNWGLRRLDKYRQKGWQVEERVVD
jgi:superfamily II DNA or RNA helicase